MFKSIILSDDLAKINERVRERGHLDREDLLEFLKIVPTSDALVIIEEVRNWLTTLHNDPTYDKVAFLDGDIEAVLGDLDSYGRVHPNTILQFKQASSKNLNPL